MYSIGPVSVKSKVSGPTAIYTRFQFVCPQLFSTSLDFELEDWYCVQR